MRKTVLFALLALPVLAQSMDQRIEKALDVRTSPDERKRLLREIVATDQGVAALATMGLSPVQDTEVVHAIVAEILQTPPTRYEPVLKRIVELLVDTPHETKVAARIEEASRAPGANDTLVKWLIELAKGEVPVAEQKATLRNGAVRALGVVPSRAAIEALVEVWAKDPDAAVRAKCAENVRRAMTAADADEAAAWLERHRYASYEEMLRRRIDDLIKENEDLSVHRTRALARATAEEAFEELGNGDPVGHRIAAGRVLDLANQGQFEPMGGKAFATRTFDAFVANRDEGDPETLAALAKTLQVLWRGDETAPLRQAKTAEDIRNALQPLSTGGPELKEAGDAAVALLKAVGEEAQITLVAFARDFQDPAVRRQAIQVLGKLAVASEASRNYIGPKLAAMLARGGDRQVRQQLLSTLSEFTGVIDALGPIRLLLQLDPGSTAEKLDKNEILFCVTILHKMATDEAYAALKQVATAHPDPEARLLAVRHGLLESQARAGEVVAFLGTLAGSAEQPLPVRVAILKALGASGWREAAPVLSSAVLAEGDASLRDAARDAHLALAERLAKPREGATVTRDDLAAGGTILEANMDAPADRREKLARALVSAADAAKLPAGTARYRLAAAYRERTDADPAEVVRLLKEAARKAQDDGLAARLEAELCLLLRKLLVDAKPDSDGWLEIAACDQRLSELSEDPQQAVSHLLNAADSACRAKRRGRADELLKMVQARAPLDATSQSRYEALAALAKELPAGS